MLNANSVDPNQTPRSAASDLVPHRFLMSLLWDVRPKWFKVPMTITTDDILKCLVLLLLF